jgi:hypothetical protein
MIRPFAITLLALVAGAAIAKLPPPSEEAKAAAAEAAAKAAHANKVADYKLCLSMDRVAERYQADAKKEGKVPAAPTPTPACVDPGPFGAAPAVAPAAPAATAAAKK